MKLAAGLFGAAALVGIGYVVCKKVMERRREEEFYDFDDILFDSEDDCECGDDCDCDSDSRVYAKERNTKHGEKIRKASLFAVGAIKTSADKLGETISDIKSKDMVKKGEDTITAVKETGGTIKHDIKRDIEDLRNKVSTAGENIADTSGELFGEAGDSLANAINDIKDDVKDDAMEIKDEMREVFGE